MIRLPKVGEGLAILTLTTIGMTNITNINSSFALLMGDTMNSLICNEKLNSEINC